MSKRFAFLVLLLLPLVVFSQIRGGKTLRPVARDSVRSSVRKPAPAERARQEREGQSAAADTVATIDMYKIITIDRDTTIVDTSLTIRAEYAANYLRRDNFGLLPFPNDGQTYNILDYGLVRHNPFPNFGFRAKHFAYMDVEDINYYNAATPYTDLFYRSAQQQGQILDAFITLNTSENLNFAVGYKGIRSIGKYINSISSNGNFRFITSYNTTDKRYHLKLHITAQDFSNQENGGIVDIKDFEESEPPFNQRERLEVYFRDATSLLQGNRYFVDHTFRLSKSNPNSIVLHHQLNYEHKFFEFTQPTVSERLGDSYTSSIRNKTRYNRMYNMLGAAYANETIGTIEFYVEDYNYNYFYRSIIIGDDGTIPNSINDRINTYGARYTYQKNKWKGSVLFSNSITDQSLTNIDASARYSFNEDNIVSFRFQKMNKLPNLNFRLYQSDYIYYNWFNNFKNEKVNNFEVEAKTQWLTASAQYTILDDHLFFSNDAEGVDFGNDIAPLLVSPKQYDNTINYFSVKLGREFRFGKFALDNTVLYQKVNQPDNILNVPDFTTRNTLYYSDYLFKRALFIQTGITFQYFTKYYANDYNPLLGEFYIQNERKIGDFPLIDFFINAKIDQFRLFFKAEHFNSGFTGYNYYSAPNYPYRDFTVRLGIIWVFFT